MSAETGILIRSENWSRAVENVAPLCRSAVRAAWETAVGDWEEACPAAEIGIALSDDEDVARLNLEYRGVEGPTNVLSFPSGDGLDGAAPVMLGDIIVAYETTAAEAAAQGKALDAHLQHLVVHGLLHLLGYDHQADHDAARMEALEAEILERLGVSDPYVEDYAGTAPKDDERTIRA